MAAIVRVHALEAPVLDVLVPVDGMFDTERPPDLYNVDQKSKQAAVFYSRGTIVVQLLSWSLDAPASHSS